MSSAASLSSEIATGTAPVRDGANLSNWRTPPFHRWSFRHLREIIASEPIACEPGDVRALAAAPRSFDGFALPGRDGASLSFAEFLRATATSAVVILKDGQIAYEAYDAGMSAGAPHMIMSMSKSILGLVAGRLSADGRLDLEAQITDLVPEVTDSAYNGASLRHLLDMRAGARFDAEETRRYTAAANWEPLAEGDPADLRSFYAATPGTALLHGGPFAYISSNSELLGWAMERATGRTYAQLVSDLLWRPMGAESEAYISLDRKGLARCTGGICAGARDLARLGQLVLDGGARDGREVIAPAWLADMRDGGDAKAWQDGEWARVFPYPQMRYRGGWYVVDSQPAMLFAMGVYGQNLFVDAANGIVIAKLSHHDLAFDYAAQMLTHKAVGEIRRCLS